ncbi:hypothetical protein OG474_09755 [Kribbella sp. NBC_01505]|uniref:hypothetical protein n=1 Tax=Kribbella sp. NBC_01505 TaxID=2903580 RepID=UPI00386F7D35
MTNPNKAKGSAFELAIFRYLFEVFGRLVRRPHNEGFKDVGDLHLSPFVIQAKNYADVATALNIGLAGAEVQKVHAGERWAVVVIKKRNAHISQARVSMTLETFREVAKELHDLSKVSEDYDNYRRDYD